MQWEMTARTQKKKPSLCHDWLVVTKAVFNNWFFDIYFLLLFLLSLHFSDLCGYEVHISVNADLLFLVVPALTRLQ
jgi:hypothetical protein